jgi:exopolyphosphatase / guanosine-5'-triphosphate,3'-diphosphate pyrophosphatase
VTRGLGGTATGPSPVLVADLGGGSTEVVLGTGSDGRVEASRSVDVGNVRLTERYLAGDPPTQDEVAAARAEVDRLLDQVAVGVPLGRARRLDGVAGTVTTVTAHALRPPAYDSSRIHASALPVEQVRAACLDLLSMTSQQGSALPYLHPGRADVIGAGALIWDRVVDRVSSAAGITEVVTSEHDILDGIAWSIIDEPVAAGNR